MSTVVDRPMRTLADLLDRLGRVPLERIRFHPAPGTATEQDVLEIAAREDRLCELIDGVLVEKPMGFEESVLASFLIRMLGNHIAPRNLGHVSGEAGMVRLFPHLIRIPDVAYFSWNRFHNGRLSGKPVPHLVPDLAVEVLSASNTAAEMEIKVEEYFAAGAQLVWLVDPVARTVNVFDSPSLPRTLDESDTLDGGTVLPEFTLAVRELFAELDRHV